MILSLLTSIRNICKLESNNMTPLVSTMLEMKDPTTAPRNWEGD